MTKKQLEIENARLRGENGALMATNSVLVDALRLNQPPMDQVISTTWPPPSTCMHDNCPTCHGTGQGPYGPCVHSLSCPCPKCSPTCASTPYIGTGTYTG